MIIYEIGRNYAAERVRLDVRQHAGKFLLTANSGTEIAKLELRSAARPLVSHDVSGDSLEISVAEKPGDCLWAMVRTGNYICKRTCPWS